MTLLTFAAGGHPPAVDRHLLAAGRPAANPPYPAAAASRWDRQTADGHPTVTRVADYDISGLRQR